MPLWIVAALVVSAAMGFSFRPAVAGSAAMWLGLVVPYAALTAAAVRWMHRRGVLADQLRFHSGDITLGALTAAVLFGGAWVVKVVALGPDSPAASWSFRLLLQLGTASGVRLSLGLAVMAILEELVWRGLVLESLTPRLGSRRAWLGSTLLYGLVHVPTAFTLAVPGLGPNPLLVVAALGAGGVWSYVAARTGRLAPVVVSHLIFTQFAPALLFPSLGG